jgi:uncharacterized protein (TIGR02466 family)
MIEYFFPTPIYYTICNQEEISKIDNEIEKYESTFDKETLINPWGDTGLTNFRYGPYHHTLNEIPTLKNKILNCSREFLTQLSIKCVNIKIAESWINYSLSCGFQNYHMHDGYDISGVYFYKSSTEDGDLIFLNPSLVSRFHKITSKEFSKISYTPEIGKLILFPSFLEHAVGINLSSSTRVSISFNVTVE